jgi:hypothetical protein
MADWRCAVWDAKSKHPNKAARNCLHPYAIRRAPMAATSIESETLEDKPESPDRVSPLSLSNVPLSGIAKPFSGKRSI